MNYTTLQISDITNAKLIGDETLVVQHILYDSRTIYSIEKTAFIAINTHKNSGEKYIFQAIEKGVRIIITENIPENNLKGITWLLVKNSLGFLKKLAHFHFQKHRDILSIGITGSNGKTVVKEWLYQSVWEDRKTVKSPKSFNSQLGLPLSVLQIENTHELAILEVGISMPGEMDEQEAVFSPKVGVLTHIGTAHIGNFKDEKELVSEKIKLFKQSETIIYNGDNKLVCNEISKIYSNKNLIKFGLEKNNDFHIISNWKNRKIPVRIKTPKGSFELNIKQRDEATLSNAMCIIALLQYLGYNFNQIIEKINALEAVEMRLESVNGNRNCIIINDSFNLDLDSLKIAFQFIKEYQKPKKSLVITDFIDGKNSDELYEEVAHLTNLQGFSKVFLVGKEITKKFSFFNAETYTFNSVEELINNQIILHLENELILLKGARKYEIEKVKNVLELQKHDTVLEVNLNAILHNIIIHKNLLHPKTKMMAMVKAYSYGLGGYEIAEFLQHHHIDYLGVAYADEGVELRKNGITTPIIVMNPEQHSYQNIIDYNLEPEIYSERVFILFQKMLIKNGLEKEYPIHIKLETGMNRLGFKMDEIHTLIHLLKNSEMRVASIFSHLSSADLESEKDFTLKQIKTFTDTSDKIIQEIGYQPIRHILNSSGIVHFPQAQLDMVRIGIGMVGISSDPKIKKNLQNAVKFKTVISQIFTVKKGESVGYGRKYLANNDTVVATIPVGYADGIPRSIGNSIGKLSVNNSLVPIIGNVCMDMMMIDISHTEAKEGDEVIIFESNPSLDDFAKYCNTIPYEVLTSISRRVKRIFIKN